MFGIEYLSRRARQWRQTRARRTLESTILDLPVALQKDIGWPAPVSPRSRVEADRKLRSPHLW